MKRLLLPLLVLTLFAGLAGCGQKGALYLPDDSHSGNAKDRFEL